jgi:septal ring factor EnvC (AmiA/AmiB activator)
MNSVELSELRVLRGVQHHHASLHELISLHSHMLIAQIEKLRSDVATLETELTESRLQQQKQLSVLREQQQLLESQNAEIEGVRASKSSHAIEIESVRNALQREIQALTEKLAVAEVAFEAEAAAKRTAEAALITARNDAEKKLSDVRAQMSEHHNALLAQQRSLLSETFA